MDRSHVAFVLFSSNTVGNTLCVNDEAMIFECQARARSHIDIFRRLTRACLHTDNVVFSPQQKSNTMVALTLKRRQQRSW